LFNSRKEQSGSQAAPAADGRIDTIIGRETEFKGTLVSSGLIRIEGRFEGEITHKGDIAVGETGVLNANIKARNLTVAGTITGNIDATGKLELLPTARLTGDISVSALVIGEGAAFKGTSAMRSADETASTSQSNLAQTN
jgi:cytoskeletal protein CcmA (bactofilin family)